MNRALDEIVIGLVFGATLALIVLLIGSAHAGSTHHNVYVTCPGQPGSIVVTCDSGDDDSGEDTQMASVKASCDAAAKACSSMSCNVSCPPRAALEIANVRDLLRRRCHSDPKWRRMGLVKCVTVTAEVP